MEADFYFRDGGGTRREFPINLLNPGTEPWNKWCETYSAQSWVNVTLAHEITVVGLGFKSANDAPHRDPDEILVKYVPVGQHASIELCSFEPKFGLNRWHTVAYSGMFLTSK